MPRKTGNQYIGFALSHNSYHYHSLDHCSIFGSYEHFKLLCSWAIFFWETQARLNKKNYPKHIS